MADLEQLKSDPSKSDPSKAGLRREMRRRLKALLPEQFRLEGERAAAHIGALPFLKDYPSVLVFLSTDLEIDTGPLLEKFFAAHKKVFVPRIEENRLCFYRAASPSGPWRLGAFNIREPPVNDGAAPLESGDFPALIITPGLAFDQNGGRLGHGRGFYDRFFAENPGPCFTLGLCLTAQIVPAVPSAHWDHRMDALCTGDGFGMSPCR